MSNLYLKIQINEFFVLLQCFIFLRSDIFSWLFNDETQRVNHFDKNVIDLKFRSVQNQSKMLHDKKSSARQCLILFCMHFFEILCSWSKHFSKFRCLLIEWLLFIQLIQQTLLKLFQRFWWFRSQRLTSKSMIELNFQRWILYLDNQEFDHLLDQ